MIFMGTYTGDRDESTTDHTTDDGGDRLPEDQQQLGVFDGEREESTENRRRSPNPQISMSGGVGVVTVPAGEDPTSEKRPESEQADSGDSDEDRDDKEDTVSITVTVDPLSAMSWGIQPVLDRVMETYGDQVRIKYKIAPVRSFDDPDEMRELWLASTRSHSMPVNPAFWDNGPESTELLNRAVLAAVQQDAAFCYLRSLWIESIAGGNNPSDRGALLDLAGSMDLNVDRFESDIDSVDIPTGSEITTLPVTEMPIRGYTQRWDGYVRYADFKEQFLFLGLEENETTDLVDFIKRYEPVATAEIVEVFGHIRDVSIDTLQEMDGIYSLDIGSGTFWITE